MTDTAKLASSFASAGWTTRYYLLDVPGDGTLAIIVEGTGDQAAWDRLFEQVAPVLGSFVFEPTGAEDPSS